MTSHVGCKTTVVTSHIGCVFIVCESDLGNLYLNTLSPIYLQYICLFFTLLFPCDFGILFLFSSLHIVYRQTFSLEKSPTFEKKQTLYLDIYISVSVV